MTPQQVRHALKQRNMTFKDFAKREGFKEDTVRRTVRRYAGKDKRIYGITTYRICSRLSRLLGQPICQGITRTENPL